MGTELPLQFYIEADAWYEELVDSDFGAYYQAASGGPQVTARARM